MNERLRAVRRRLADFALKGPDEQRAEIDRLRAAFEEHSDGLPADWQEYWQATIELMEAIGALDPPASSLVAYVMNTNGFEWGLRWSAQTRGAGEGRE